MGVTDPSHAGLGGSRQDRAQLIRLSLRNAITDRRLAPGTKLSESEVGTIFDASRTVVRVALQMLALEGLTRIERNRGAFVSSPSPEEARQVFAARRLIEPGMAASAAERFSMRDAGAFRAQLKAEERQIGLHGPDARRAEIKASGDFHLLVARVAANPIIQKYMDELVARSSLVISLYGRSGASSCGYREHAEMLAAMKRREAKKASAIMAHHLDHIEADLDFSMPDALVLKDALRQ